MQRKFERTIRKVKRELIAADETKDKEMFTAKSIKLRRLREGYKDFSNKAGLLTQNERTQVAGYGRSISGKAGYETRKYIQSLPANTSGGRTRKQKIWASKDETQQEEIEKKYYEQIRKCNWDVKAIAKNTPFTEKAIKEIKYHLFYEKVLRANGERKLFDPDIDEAKAWLRLMNGHGTEADLLLLRHEYVELAHMKSYNSCYEDAHDYANTKHNWQDAEKESFWE